MMPLPLQPDFGPLSGSGESEHTSADLKLGADFSIARLFAQPEVMQRDPQRTACSLTQEGPHTEDLIPHGVLDLIKPASLTKVGPSHRRPATSRAELLRLVHREFREGRQRGKLRSCPGRVASTSFRSSPRTSIRATDGVAGDAPVRRQCTLMDER